jgi:hypothetical protein
VGWALLGLCLIMGGAVRFGGAGNWALVIAVASGLVGLLAIVNVLLVRSLYRQIADAPPPPSAGEDA